MKLKENYSYDIDVLPDFYDVKEEEDVTMQKNA